MQKTTENFNASDRRLQKACEYVNDLWFPANSELLAKIKLGLKGGVYDIDPESLVTSITGDFSLFMYCLRELMEMLKKEGVDLPPLANPVEVLRVAGLDRLKAILNVEEARISKHALDSTDELQIARLEESMVSASASQVLAASYNINAEAGFSAALLRQLGLTLIAWNYPTVYKEALTALNYDMSLDVALAERLGFSPTLLAIRILISWGMPAEYCEALFLMDDEEDEGELEDEEDELTHVYHNILSGSLAKLCCVGEALARANNPKLYPTAKDDWAFAKEAIADKLGPQGIELIKDALTENIDNFITFMPELFTGAFILDPEARLAEAESDSVLAKNPYLALCEQPLKAQLTSIYFSLVPGQYYEKGLNELIRQIIPEAGFSGGIVYTVDPGIQMLVPQTRIGSPQLKGEKPIDYSIVLSNSDSISVAYRTTDPVIQFLMGNNKELLCAISSVIGHSSRIGVLYLEIPHELFVKREQSFISEFKAIARSLTDCLNLD